MLTTYNRCPWAFQRCRQEETDIDLSQESLTSREVLQLLRKIEKEDIMLYSDTQVDSTNRSVFLGQVEKDLIQNEGPDDSVSSDVELGNVPIMFAHTEPWLDTYRTQGYYQLYGAVTWYTEFRKMS